MEATLGGNVRRAISEPGPVIAELSAGPWATEAGTCSERAKVVMAVEPGS